MNPNVQRARQLLYFFRMLLNRYITETVALSNVHTDILGLNSFKLKLTPFFTFSSVQFSSVAWSCPTLRPHESQHARPAHPSPTPRVHSNSCPLSRWCHPTISSSVVLLPPIPPSIRVFSNESTLCIRWPKYWSFSFSISPSKEHPGLISFGMDWLHLLVV